MIEWGPKCTDSSHSVSIGIIGDYVDQIHKPETERDGKKFTGKMAPPLV